MLRLLNLEEIQTTLLRLPALVRGIEGRDPRACERVNGWLVDMEAVLQNNRLSTAAGIACLRGILLAAERGAVPADLVVRPTATRRMIREAVAAHLLDKAYQVVIGDIQKDRDRVAEAERIMRQVIAMAKHKKVIPAAPDTTNQSEWLRFVWKTIGADPELAPGTVSVDGLMGAGDVLILLDRALTADRLDT